MSYSFLIVDDEELSRNYIADLLAEFYPEARIAASVSNTQQARRVLMEDDIDVIFLDIKMPGENGIEFLNSIKEKDNYKTVFITAYNDYTIQAIKAAAYDYLLKPIDKKEFKETVDRVRKALDMLYRPSYEGNGGEAYLDQKLTIHHSNGFRFIRLGDIIYLQASNNYTNIQLTSGELVIVSKPLKEFQQKLNPACFFRVHKSYIINIHQVDQYSSSDGGQVLMKNGENIYISRYKLSDFFTFVASFTNGLKA